MITVMSCADTTNERISPMHDLPKQDRDRLYFEQTAARVVAAADLAARDKVDLAGCGTADLPSALSALTVALTIAPDITPAEDDTAMRTAAVQVTTAYTASLSNIESLYIGTENSTSAAELTFAVDMLRRGLAAIDEQG